jgi:hypothetical protein
MPRYKVQAVCRTYYEHTFDAPSLPEAIVMADQMDGSDFTETEAEWETFHLDTEEVKGEDE